MPALLFSKMHSFISTDAPPLTSIGASVEFPNVHNSKWPSALSPLNCMREECHSHISEDAVEEEKEEEEEDDDESRFAENVHMLKTALPLTAMMFAGVDGCGMKETNEVSVSVSVYSELTVTSGLFRICE